MFIYTSIYNSDAERACRSFVDDVAAVTPPEWMFRDIVALARSAFLTSRSLESWRALHAAVAELLPPRAATEESRRLETFVNENADLRDHFV